MFRASVLVTIIAGAGSIVSFLNQLVLARIFGASRALDIYLVAISVPISVMALAVGVVGYQLVPVFQKSASATGNCEPLVHSVASGLGLISLLTAIMVSFGFDSLLHFFHPNLTPSGLDNALHIWRIAWFWLPFAVISAIYTAALHVRQRFVLGTFMQMAPVVGSLLFCLFGSAHLGVEALAWGQLVGFAVSASILTISIGAPKSLNFRWSEFREIAGSAPVSLAALAIFIIYPVSDAFWGSKIAPSIVSYLGYAQRLIVALSGIAVLGTTTVIFPRLAKFAAQGSHELLRQNLALGFRVILLIMFPLAAILSVVSQPLIQLLFQRGAFTFVDTVNLSRLMPWMLCGMVAMGCTTMAFKALFAQHRAVQGALISLGVSVCYVVLSGILSRFFGVIGIGAAYATSWWLAFGLALATLWSGQGRPPLRKVARFIRNLVVASSIAGLGSSAVTYFFPPDAFATNVYKVCVLLFSSLVGLSMYFAFAQGPLAVEEVRMITSRLLGPIRRRSTPSPPHIR